MGSVVYRLSLFGVRRSLGFFGPTIHPLGAALRLGCTALQCVVACFLGTDNEEVEKEALKIASWLVKRGAMAEDGGVSPQ